MVIHPNAAQSRSSELKERKNQREGNVPSPNQVHPKYRAGMIDNEEEVLVTTTHSGSMTQETFFHWSRHFVMSLPPFDCGPVILFLDGHGSRWSVPSLQYLRENQVFPFFS